MTAPRRDGDSHKDTERDLDEESVLLTQLIRQQFDRPVSEQVMVKHLGRLSNEVNSARRRRSRVKVLASASLVSAAAVLVALVLIRPGASRIETGPAETTESTTAPQLSTVPAISTSTSAAPESNPTTIEPTTATSESTSTANEPTTVVTLPGPTGAPFQDQLDTEVGDMNACLGGNLELFVGFPGDSDHPKLQDSGYLAAIDRCSQFSDVQGVFDGHAVWEAGLSDAQRDVADAALTPVHQCLLERGWDVGTLVVNSRGLLTFSRYPAVSWGQRANGTYTREFTECGWYDLELG
ncbi:MAG: hypothetical protein ACRBK7_01895 [Acidimicrobiales bacterium]